MRYLVVGIGCWGVLMSAGWAADAPGAPVMLNGRPPLAVAPEVAESLNPFTGDAKALEDGARELARLKQRRAIAEARLAEQKALLEIERLKHEGMAFTASVPTSVRADAIAAEALASQRVASASIEPSGVMQGSRKPAIRRAPAGARTQAAVARTGSPARRETDHASDDPHLTGVIESHGHRYALIAHRGRTVSIEEGHVAQGVSIGAIDGRDVRVNGSTQSLEVGTQTLAVPRRDTQAAVGATTRGGGDARSGSIAPTAAAAQDLTALKLPLVPDVGASVGPQSLAGAVAWDAPSARAQP